MRHLLSFLCLLAYIPSACAVELIRDAEIEHTLHEYADPVFRAAGLNPEAVRIFIVQDDSLNSFVAGGENVFVHTGIIEACTNPGMLIGVLAHETGHIAGGHLARGAEQLERAQMGTILSFVLGAAAAVGSGKPEAAAAVIAGGTSASQRGLLAFSRANEEAADQSALSSLAKLNISASGMLDVFELLRRREQQFVGNVDPYMLTHPLSKERLADVRAHVEQSSIPVGQYPKRFDVMHQRMLAKLHGFLDKPERTLARYPLSDHSAPARLARAVAYHQQANLAQALAEIDSLIAEAPKDPFYNELKGQILFENGRAAEALPYYRKAVLYFPNSALLMSDLGRIEITVGDPASAVPLLEKSTHLDNTNAETWRLLATAYAKLGQDGQAALALGEEALLENDARLATSQAEAALNALPPGPARQRAEDVKARALELKKEKT